MAYVKRIVCLAASFKPPDGRCIAGIELLPQGGHAGWVRPVSDRPTEELSFVEYRYESKADPKLLDIIDVPLLRAAPRNHQIENHVIDPLGWWQKSGDYPWDHLEEIQDHPETLWVNGTRSVTGVNDCVMQPDSQKLDNSLLLIKATTLKVEAAMSALKGRRSYRGKFQYHGIFHNLSITDPAIPQSFDSKVLGEYPLYNVFLCVSLTQPYRDGRCYKLIAALLTRSPF